MPRRPVAIDLLCTPRAGPGCGSDPMNVQYEMRLKPEVAACLARKVSEAGLRRPLGETENSHAAALASIFIKGGYDMRPVLREVATGAAFFAVPSPR